MHWDSTPDATGTVEYDEMAALAQFFYTLVSDALV